MNQKLLSLSANNSKRKKRSSTSRIRRIVLSFPILYSTVYTTELISKGYQIFVTEYYFNLFKTVLVPLKI